MSMTRTQRQSTLGFLSKTMREEAELQPKPSVRNRMIHNARSLSWTYRNLSTLDPAVVDSLIDASIDIIVHFASARVPWKVVER